MGILNRLKKQNKLALILLIGIILLAAYLRLYRIADYQTFLGDEGRDVLVAKGILDGDFTLLGPRASAGDFFLGPIYYYMIAPWLWIFRYDPVGPAVMVGLLGVATVWLTYYVGKKWFGEKVGLMAAALYTVSPIVINYSHSSWNPDVLPFFSLVLMYLLYLAVQAKKATKHFLLVGFLLGVCLQLHYLALFLGVIVAVYTFLGSWYHTKRLQLLLMLRRYGEIFLGFIVGLSPFLLFELRHGFPNIRTIFSFIFSDTLQKTYATHVSFSSIVQDVFFRVFAKLVFYYPGVERLPLYSDFQLNLLTWGSMILALASIVGLWFVKNRLASLLVFLWLFFGVLLFGFYKKQIYDYYFTFFFPLPFLIIGNFLGQLMDWGKRKPQKIIASALVLALFAGIFVYNLTGNPFQYEPNRQKNQAKIISEAVIKASENKPYNFALISKGNSDHAYRYFLETLGHPPVTLENMILDPQRTSVTKQLIIVCEDTSCQPLGHSLFEVAGFGRAEIAGSWDVSVVKVYRLVPYVEKKGE